MKREGVTKPEIEASQAFFEHKFESIVGRGLDARNITAYADNALKDLIELVDTVIHESAIETRLTGREREEEAFSLAGLNPEAIEQTLDHIAGVSDSIRRLDSLVMNSVQLVDAVLVPPDPSICIDLTVSNNSFESSKEIIPKLHTLLLLLERVFAIDIEDSKSTSIHTGVLHPKMMRGESYYMVQIPELERVVLTCDEVGNATYVFNIDVCIEYGISSGYLVGQHKAELNELVEQEPRLGTRITYSNNYADELADALRSKQESVEKSQGAKNSPVTMELLRPQPQTKPEGWLSMRGIALQLGVDYKKIKTSIAMLNIEGVGHRIGPRTVTTYSPEQIHQIAECLILAPVAPEGWRTVNGIANQLSMDHHTVSRAIASLGLNNTKKYRFTSGEYVAYSPRQIQSIAEHLDSKTGAPEDWLSANGIARRISVGHLVVTQAIKTLGISGVEHKFGHRVATAYTPDQVQEIAAHLSRPELPDDYLSAKGISKQLGVSSDRLAHAIDFMGIVAREFKSQHKIVSAYSPSQIEKIAQHLDIKPYAPKGWLSANGIAKKLNVDRKAVLRAMEVLAFESSKYRLAGTAVSAYSPEQVGQIAEYFNIKPGTIEGT